MTRPAKKTSTKIKRTKGGGVGVGGKELARGKRKGKKRGRSSNPVQKKYRGGHFDVPHQKSLRKRPKCREGGKKKSAREEGCLVGKPSRKSLIQYREKGKKKSVGGTYDDGFFAGNKDKGGVGQVGGKTEIEP